MDGVRDGAVLVRVTAPPHDGAANDAVIALLADRLNVPRRAVTIESGAAGRLKRIHVQGISSVAAMAALLDNS